MLTHTRSERGIAIILALFLMTALSVLGASLMFLSQSETYASMNYRMMSQSRYGGEAAIQKAASFLLDPAQYVPPTAAELAASYNFDVSPVTLKSNGLPVVLSANATCSGSNYSVTAVQTAFCNAAKGTMPAGNASVSYNATATLISMQSFDSYSGAPVVIQTWQITGDGAIAGPRSATVEVAATIETPKMPAYGYAAFATSPNCAALQFQGHSSINGYDPGVLSGGTPVLSSDGGDVGTNGNLDISGSVDVSDKLYTPRSGVGACSAGNVTALTATGHLAPANGEVHLPGYVPYPTPTIPAYSTIGDITAVGGTTCATLGLTSGTAAQVAAGTAQCNVTGSTITLNATSGGNGTTMSLPTFNLSSHIDVVLMAAPAATATTHNQYNFNSISLNGGATIAVSTTSPTEGIIVDIVGKDSSGAAIATPLDFAGGGMGGTFAAPVGCASCSAFDASLLQLVYGGTGNIVLTGNSAASAAVYAPNATAQLRGTADLYGSIVASQLTIPGNASVHYDRNLQGLFYVPGNTIIGTFTWKRY